MKKLCDWTINLVLHVENGKKLRMVCSVHTSIHQIKIQICKQLDLPVFDTEMDIYSPDNGIRSMKPTSSLQQNGVTADAGLRVVIKRKKINNTLDVKVEQNTDKKDKVKNDDENYGLTLKAACTNHHCVNYQQDILISVGYGSFPFYNLISSLKCDVCPYKSQNLRPPMMCKEAYVENCLYRLSGTLTDAQGIPSDKSTPFYKMKSRRNIIEKVLNYGWDKNIVIAIKHL